MNPQKTICLCDDDQEILDATSCVLTNAGYNVVMAHDHKELTSKLQDCAPDLIILDVRMPERDGFWVAECLQVLGNTVPIMFMTACDKMIYRLYAPFVGSVEYLTKPVDPRLLLKKIERALAA
jgi:DNA-binding response OmpR family regulator